MVLSSASEPTTFMYPLPSLSLAISVASASLLPLFLAATSLYAGPIFFFATPWQPRQPSAFARSAPTCATAGASCGPLGVGLRVVAVRLWLCSVLVGREYKDQRKAGC